jgi:hypothetical protein
MDCCHNNGVKTDNRLANLRWDTRAANIQDAKRHGTWIKGETCGRSKLTEQQVREIFRLSGEGWNQIRIAQRFSVVPSAISMILSGRNWGHLNLAMRPRHAPKTAERQTA